jgi:hypothetical protein
MNIALVNIFPKDHIQVLREPCGATEMLILQLANYLQKQFTIDFYYTGEGKTIENINYINIYNNGSHSKTYSTLIINRFINILEYNFTNNCHNIIIWFHDLPPGPNNIETLNNHNDKLTIVFVSQYLKDLYVNMFPFITKFNLVVIHNFIDLSVFSIDENTDLRLENKAFDILYMSAYGKSIFNDNYLNILIELGKTYSIAVTHPNYEDRIEISEKNKQLRMLGFYVLDPMNKQTLGQLIQDSRIVIAPHFKETFGCFAIESLYLGTPIIYHPDSGALKEIVSEYYSVDIYDIRALGDKIHSIISNPTIVHKKSFLIDYIGIEWLKIIS